MKKDLTRFYLSSNIVIAILFSFASLSSCKKEVTEPIIIDTPKDLESVSNESLINFLSISLNVPKGETVFDAYNQEFVVWGKLRLKRTVVEEHYINANVYQAIYGK